MKLTCEPESNKVRRCTFSSALLWMCTIAVGSRAPAFGDPDPQCPVKTEYRLADLLNRQTGLLCLQKLTPLLLSCLNLHAKLSQALVGGIMCGVCLALPAAEFRTTLAHNVSSQIKQARFFFNK